MRIVREQMLCILSPAPAGVAHALAAHEAALRAALAASGVVHFAALALLPGRPFAAAGAAPTLLLELAVDEGLRPADTLTALVQAGFAPLWALYGAAWPGGPEADRPAWLRAELLRRTSIADGGFVGARDRGVAQIHDERALLAEAVAAARRVEPGVRAQAATWAHAVASGVLVQPRFGWARALWPNSFWRGQAASWGGKLRWLVGMGLVAALFLWAARAIAGGLSRSLPGKLRPAAAFVHDICAGILAAVPLLGRAWVALVVMFLIARLIAFFVPLLKRIVPAIDEELDRADARPVATLYEALVAVLGIALALALAAGFVGLVAAAFPGAIGAAFAPAAAWVDAGFAAARTHGQTIAWLALAGAAGLVLVSAHGRMLPATFAARAAAGYQAAGLWRPHEVPRAQRIDPAVEACEAALAREGRVAHMISLVDIRKPVPLFRFSLRLWLRLITLAGRVIYTEGRLGDAPGIHFGHWHIVDEGRRLLFCSNYDGKWGGYLDDFINGASRGLNAIWHCTTLLPRPAARPGDPAVAHARDFPPTRLGLWRGVKCEQWFKAFARDSMVPHLFRFEAYPMSLQSIERATALREALAGERNVVNDDRIMRIIES